MVKLDELKAILDEWEGDALELDYKIANGEIPELDNVDAKMKVALWFALQDALKQLAQPGAESEALRLKAKHTVQSVNIIRGVMRINQEHKDLFGGAVYLVDHTHMWALVRNAEDLDALLTVEDK